jgi:hypothetical protein
MREPPKIDLVHGFLFRQEGFSKAQRFRLGFDVYNASLPASFRG